MKQYLCIIICCQLDIEAKDKQTTEEGILKDNTVMEGTLKDSTTRRNIEGQHYEKEHRRIAL